MSHPRIVVPEHFDSHGTRLPADVASCVQAHQDDPEGTFRDYEGALHPCPTESNQKTLAKTP